MKLRWIFAMIVGVLLMGARTSSAAYFDYSVYDGILRHYVDVDGYVDYDSVRLNSMTALESYFETMSNADLAGWPATERQSFWINAYNARVLYIVAQNQRLKKMPETLELLKHPFKIAGQMLSPADIKHLLRKEGDPRILFALSDGTIGGPRLYNTAYTSDDLDTFLQTDASDFVNSLRNIKVVNDHLRFSYLFNWYAKDFEKAGGIPAFVSSLLNANLRGDAGVIKQLLTTNYGKTTFFYNWTINDLKNKSTSQPTDSFTPGNVPPDASSTSDPDLRNSQ